MLVSSPVTKLACYAEMALFLTFESGVFFFSTKLKPDTPKKEEIHHSASFVLEAGRRTKLHAISNPQIARISQLRSAKTLRFFPQKA